ncbi:hypothetical protein HY639_04745 [Candidatus Woesearchaeota archaeon]|nr:hypothetical protein [Candidatus Woesearchaeota archaeon]
MTKKKETEEPQEPQYTQQSPSVPKTPEEMQKELEAKIPPEVREKLEKIKVKLEKFKDQILAKFDKYITGVALMPPRKPEEGQQPNPDAINVLVVVDDSDSKKMSKQELKEKLGTIIDVAAKEIDKNIVTETVIISELWQSCCDGKYDLLQTIAMAAPIFDRGILRTIKIAEIHKTMVLKKFEKYIVSYVVAGSVLKGYAKETSDIDTYVIIDDTDVKKMTRAELKDKLRAIIISMGMEAGEMTGIRNKLHIQVYILTEFWDALREANPVIFTLLRNCVPFYDRGIFMPWKQLLEMGRIKPSAEAIDMFMGSGEQMLKRAEFKLRDIAMEDTFLAILTPTQAAFMLYGLPPPAPKECGDMLREVFVNKEKLLEDKFVEIYERSLKVRKDIEHGLRKDVKGKEVDELLDDADKYLKRIKRLFTQIEKIKEEEAVLHIYESSITLIRDLLRAEGIEKVLAEEVISKFDNELIASGKIPAKYLRVLNTILEAKRDFDAKKLTKTQLEDLKKEYNEFVKVLVEYLQRKRGREMERVKLRVRYGKKHGEVILLGKTAFVVNDIDAEEKELSKAVLNPDGSLGPLEKSSLEEYEGALAKVEVPERVFIKERIFENLKKIFGPDVEVLLNP